MLDLAAVAALNHLLAPAYWARERLAPFTGRQVRIVLPPFSVTFRIAADGTLETLGEGEPDVEVFLPGAPLSPLTGRDGLMRGARVSGAVAFAEALGFVLHRLEWDMEEDLSRVVGDVVAHRLTGAARSLAAAQREMTQRLVENVSECLLLYEWLLWVPKGEVATLGKEVFTAEAESESLERRLTALENKLG